jgi:hypothetical protein
MKAKRFCIETVGLSAAMACALALLIATLAAATAAVLESPAWGQAAESPAAAQQTYEGMVTCSHCGARHNAFLGRTASDCSRVCVRGGAAFALVDGDRTRQLDGDLAAISKYAGQRARVVGALRAQTIQVSSIAPLNW